MPVQYPDYRNSIANLACSILNHYGITPPNATLPAADELLKSHPARHVVVLLLDGMGVANMEKHLSPEGFFRKHLLMPYSSTFPPTTVAATTAALSGLTPNQSAWLGWVGYFPQVNRNIVYYWNVDNDTGEEMKDCNVPWTYVPYRNLPEQIREAGTAAHNLAPFLPPFPKTYDAFCKQIETLCAREEPSYVYAYWDEPDHTMHERGVDGREIGELMRHLERRTEEMAAKLEDTLLIITADHGHINNRNVEILRYPEIADCLVRMPSIELRAVNLFVKPGMEKQLEAAFARYFPEDFILLSKEEVLKQQLLGTGGNHPLLECMLGDYLAIGTGEIGIAHNAPEHKGNHAGITPAEMTIPLIAVPC